MNYPFVHQLGFVVRDMDKAMEEYGKIPMQRGRGNMFGGVLTGNAKVVKRMGKNK